MTYARSRLWLGISGVGLIVVISTFLLISGWPLKLLSDSRTLGAADLYGLLAMICFLIVTMTPLDLLGGYLLPNRSRPSTIKLSSFLKSWVRGVVVQATFFLLAGLFILVMGRSLGLAGSCLAIFLIGVFQVAFQSQLSRLVASLPKEIDQKIQPNSAIDSALALTSRWGWESIPVFAVDNDDTGFTGGVVGLPGFERIIVPGGLTAKLAPEQFAVTVARRLESIQTGSRTRGLVVAFVWVLLGFSLSASVPGAGVTSVGELAMTCCGFTLWTFLGLLTLPTLSRQASYAIDGKLLSKLAQHDVPPETLHTALRAIDQLQDDEPERSALIETIFHPVPSVENRRNETVNSLPIAWHAARMTLFLSWSCMGMLPRAVHCNVGRPELWVMLPTD